MTFFSARQLQDLHQQSGANGRLVLPYRARLTPAAHDWIRSRKIELGYDDAQSAPAAKPTSNNAGAATPAVSEPLGGAAGAFLWWCDGPCGPAKAAVTAFEKELSLRALDLPGDARRLVAAVKDVAISVKQGRATGGVLLVPNGAAAMIFANRCPSLRAVLATGLDAVEQGIRLLAANVLVIEYPRHSLQQMKNMLARFLRARRDLSVEAAAELKELASCG